MNKIKSVNLLWLSVGVIFYLALSFVFSSFSPADFPLAPKAFFTFVWIFVSTVATAMILNNKRDYDGE